MKSLLLFASISCIVVCSCNNRYGHGMEVDNPSVNTETIVQKDTSSTNIIDSSAK